MSTSGKDILARIKPVLRTESTTICLRPDLLDEHDILAQELASLTVTGKRLAGGPGSTAEKREIAEKIASLEDQIEAVQVTFKFEALPIHKYRAIADSNPPRRGDEIDQMVGYNRDAVLDRMVRASMLEPSFDDCEEDGCSHGDCGTWQQFVRVCNPGEWQELRNTVNSVNRGVVESPKSALASRILAKPASDLK